MWAPQAQADIEYFTSEYQIDYLKIDADSGGHKYTNPGGYCGSEHVRNYNRSYPLVSRLLNASGRKIGLQHFLELCVGVSLTWKASPSQASQCFTARGRWARATPAAGRCSTS